VTSAYWGRVNLAQALRVTLTFEYWPSWRFVQRAQKGTDWPAA